jgi:hypothetical protein
MEEGKRIVDDIDVPEDIHSHEAEQRYISKTTLEIFE